MLNKQDKAQLNTLSKRSTELALQVALEYYIMRFNSNELTIEQVNSILETVPQLYKATQKVNKSGEKDLTEYSEGRYSVCYLHSGNQLVVDVDSNGFIKIKEI